MVKALVLRVEGTNCDQETVNALQVAGAETTLAHINQLLKKKDSLENYDILAIPGGFSHGDDISAGVILAKQLKFLLGKQVRQFVEERKPVIGICNGFQVLVKTGLLPGNQGIMEKQEATLAFNEKGIFYDDWVQLEPQENKCLFLKKIKERINLPIAHAEGRFIAEQEILEELEENKQIVFKYVKNPNGSINDIAGICNPEGNVFGLMPHPERFLNAHMHPQWTRGIKKADGLQFFTEMVEYAEKR